MSCENNTPITTTNPNANRSANCVSDIVRFINRLQQAVVPTEIGCSRCNTPILGETSKANTRPFILYLPNGEAFKLAVLTDNPSEPIPVFRVEEVNGNCATLRALANRRLPCHPNSASFDEFNGAGFETELLPTRTCVTVNLNDFIAIQCLDDVFVNLEMCNCN